MEHALRLKAKILHQIEQSPGLAVMISFLGLVLIGLLDIVSGYELGIALFYLFPIMLATWAGGRSTGILMALAGAALWLFADLIYGFPYRAPPSPYVNALMRLGIFVIVAQLVFTARHSLRIERELSRSDPLTGCANWRAINESLQNEIERSRRFRRPFSLVYIDINKFKNLNDRYGHKVGDRALQGICSVLSANLRSTDKLGRLGGDEFAVVLPECTGQEARTAVSRWVQACEQLFHDRGWPIGLSIGIGTFNGESLSVDQALEFVDRLMYSGKMSPDERVQFADYGGEELAAEAKAVTPTE